MPPALAVHLVAAAAAPWIVERVGRRAFLALVPASALVWAATVTPRILAGDTLEASIGWVPTLAMNLDFRLDSLALLMTMVVGGVGPWCWWRTPCSRLRCSCS